MPGVRAGAGLDFSEKAEGTVREAMDNSKQLSIFDWEAESAAPVPTLWDCRRTCKRFGEKVDYPSWWFGEARCLLVEIKSKSVNNKSVAWCTKYECKEAKQDFMREGDEKENEH